MATEIFIKPLLALTPQYMLDDSSWGLFCWLQGWLKAFGTLSPIYWCLTRLLSNPGRVLSIQFSSEALKVMSDVELWSLLLMVDANRCINAFSVELIQYLLLPLMLFSLFGGILINYSCIENKEVWFLSTSVLLYINRIHFLSFFVKKK